MISTKAELRDAASAALRSWGPQSHYTPTWAAVWVAAAGAIQVQDGRTSVPSFRDTYSLVLAARQGLLIQLDRGSHMEYILSDRGMIQVLALLDPALYDARQCG